jgi:rhodanese-related sulfurtransferase
MNFPLNAFHEVGLDGSLLISVLVGIGFGFFLEQGGFGSSKVLAGIFYGRDWRVLKVMFTAIVTAMVGLYAFDGLGLLAMDQIAYKSTYLWPQIVGGLILGVGFVTAGYCPGTSMVGLVSGKLDALFVMAGVILGIGVFEEGYSLWSGFYESSYMGELSIQAWLGVPAGAVVLGVSLMAFGAFAAVEYFERGRDLAALRPWLSRMGPAVVGAGVLGFVLQVAGPGEARAMSAPGAVANVPSMAAIELAEWSVEARANFMLFDLRAEGAEPRLLSSYQLPAASLLDLRHRPSLPKDRVLVVLDERDEGAAREVVASLRRAGLQAVCLSGGAAAFEREVLDPDVLDPRAAAYRFLARGESPFGGAAPAAPVREKKAPPARKKKKSTGCS